jgi:SulP family sulfate permease
MGHVVADDNIRDMSVAVTTASSELRAREKARDTAAIVDLHYQLDLMKLAIANMEKENKERMQVLNKVKLERAKVAEGQAATLYLAGEAPPDVETDGHKWHIKKIEGGQIKLVGGGDVVGAIPQGLPAFRVPTMSMDAFTSLFSAALIIALVAFMESISMAKAMATKSKQRVDPSQELIGQGLSNIGGAFFQAYPACGSFTGSAINLQAGAKTGFAMVFNGIFVAVTLLFLTPYLYHLPKAVLAVIILLAVVSLIQWDAIKHTWQASRIDGFVTFVTFAATLLAAPHLDKGIMIGAGLAILLYLHRTMTPRVVVLGRMPDGTLRDAKVNNLPASKIVTAIRFDGRLYFANVAYFEDAVLEAVANNPEAPYVLIVGDGINDIDASGEEVIHHLVERLNESGIVMVFAELKKQVLDVMRATGLRELIGERRFFATADVALETICSRAEYADEECGLRPQQRSDKFSPRELHD